MLASSFLQSFRMSIDVPAAAGPSSPASASPRPAAAVQPRALIIDDEATIRTALRRYFARRGWTVDEAEDGQVALAALSVADAGSYDVIISDLKMPGLTGIELHDRLRASRPELLGRLVFSTGDVASPQASDFVARTTCPVLQKPFELAILGELVERIRRRA